MPSNQPTVLAGILRGYADRPPTDRDALRGALLQAADLLDPPSQTQGPTVSDPILIDVHTASAGWSANRWRSSDEIHASIAAGESLTDEDACHIAAWWQGPTGHGLALARLASTGIVPADDLVAAIGAELDTCAPTDSAELAALLTWAERKAAGP